MKKIISIVSIALFSASAFAADAKKAGNNLQKQTIGGMQNTNRGGFARKYGLAGCGLGSMVMGNRDGQIFAATTNGTSGSQTFGITTGTSNCEGSPTSAKADNMDKYIVANKVSLADDIARGQGETLAGLAQVMKCENSAKLGTTLQSNFSNIFTTHELAPNEITDKIITVVGQDAELAKACGIVI